MKRVVIAVLVMALLIGLCVTSYLTVFGVEERLSARLDAIAQTLEAGDYGALPPLVTAFCEEWRYDQRFLVYFVHHGPVDQIAVSVSTLETMVQNERYEEFAEECAKISALLGYIVHAQKLTLSNLA